MSRVLGLIPARSGSKSIPKKNIKLFSGKPLLAWSIIEAKKSSILTDIVVSTDDPQIAQIALQYGASAPFIRPKSLATDTSLRNDVVLHALSCLDPFDYVMLLQPTSPFRTSQHIDDSYQQMMSHSMASCVSVKTQTPSPHWIFSGKPDLSQRVLTSFPASTNRQSNSSFYVLNGAIYIANTALFYDSSCLDPFVSHSPFLYLMDKLDSQDIDDEIDWAISEFLFSNRP